MDTSLDIADLSFCVKCTKFCSRKKRSLVAVARRKLIRNRNEASDTIPEWQLRCKIVFELVLNLSIWMKTNGKGSSWQENKR